MKNALTKLVGASAAVYLALLCGCHTASPNSFIASLKPVRVYDHRGNLVVVQAITNGVERGRYITSSLSSYRPRDEDDGFKFGAGTSLTEQKGLAAEYRLGEMYDYTRSQPEH